MCAMPNGTKALSESSYGEIYNADPFEIYHDVFKEGVRIFKESLTNDPKKKDMADKLLSNDTKIDDVIKSVVEAKSVEIDAGYECHNPHIPTKSNYESSRGKSKFRETLTALSQRIVYYGNVMDVLVQQHPEYVSLVWGIMKLIFGAIVEHERTVMDMATALCEISDSLPAIRVGTILYPNVIVKRSASMLYAHIVQFLIRALIYYKESKLARAVQSISKPSALYYNDLLKSIKRDTEVVMKHMTVCSQAAVQDLREKTDATHKRLETMSDQMECDRRIDRDNHQKIHDAIVSVTREFDDMKKRMDLDRALEKCTRLRNQTNFSDILLRQALEMVSSRCNIRHKSVLWSAVHLYNQWQVKREFRFEYGPFWNSPKLREWNMSKNSSTILVRSPSTARRQIMAFCTEVVDQLMRNRATVLWVLAERNKTYPLLDALTSLVYQALSLGHPSRRENKTAFEPSQFLDAYTEEDYLVMLAKLLQHSKLVYIIVNGDSMSPNTALQCRECLGRLSQILSDHKSRTLLRVITTSSRPEKNAKQVHDTVLTVEKMSKRKIRKQSKRYRKRNIKLFD